jgi:hypothetical protein
MALNVMFCKEFLSVKMKKDSKDIDLPSQFIKTAHEQQTEPNGSPIPACFSLSKSCQPKLLCILI